MALTNEDIFERFEVGEDGKVRWRKLDLTSAPRWAREYGRGLNDSKGGEEVKFFTHPSTGRVVKLYGGTVSEARVLRVLRKQTVQDAEQARVRSAKRAATAAKANEVLPTGPMADAAAQRQAAMQRAIWVRDQKVALGFKANAMGAWHNEAGEAWHDDLLPPYEGEETA